MKQWFHFWHVSTETQNTNLKEDMHSYVCYRVIYSSQNMEANQVPINRQVDTN